MKKMAKAIYTTLLSGVLIFMGTSCGSDGDTESIERISTVHYNIHIVPDLSNRVEQKQKKATAPHDTVVINDLLDAYLPKIYPHRRKIQQKDIIRVTRINPRNATDGFSEFSLHRFGMNQAERISYVQDSVNGLSADMTKLKSYVKKVFDDRDQHKNSWSGDLYSFMENSLNSLNTIKDSVVNMPDDIEYIESHRNIVILFTDGYIEYGNYNSASSDDRYFLDAKLIKEVRTKCQVDGINPGEVLAKYDMGLKKAKNDLLRYYDFILLELDDRSLNPSGSATERPTDLEIIKALWQKWLQDSGVRSCSFYAIGDADMDEIIKKHVLVN
jgi:hypothetical protein